MLSYTHLNKTRTVQFKGGLEGLHVFSAKTALVNTRKGPTPLWTLLLLLRRKL